MKITLQLENDYLPDKYGKFAQGNDMYKGQPITSFPIQISDIPAGTQYLSLSLVDYDAIPVCGFPWIHWTAANISVSSDKIELPENFSQLVSTDKVVQGKNSNASPFIGETDEKIIHRYTGPTPPDKAHEYTLVISALSEKLDLTEGFWWNELRHAQENKVLAQEKTTFISKA